MASSKPEKSPKADSEGKRQELVQESSRGQTCSHPGSAAGNLDAGDGRCVQLPGSWMF